MWIYIICFILAYFVGNISPSYLFSKYIAKEDIRTKGSGNAGSTNMFREYGYAMGLSTLLVDALKGAIVVLLVRWLAGDTASYIAGVGVVVGHNWGVFLGFKGGKGVATSLGVMFAVNWFATLIVFAVAIVVIILTKMVAVASLLGAISYGTVVYILYWGNDWPLIICVTILVLLVLYSHRTNIQRLMNGTEKKLNFKPGGNRRNLK